MVKSNANSAADGAIWDEGFETATYRKIAMRLLVVLCIGYFLAFLDRVNIGFAKLQMAGDLGLGDKVYGFGAGIFFIGYFLFEIPSNLALQRFGARRWIARIMISWGLLSASLMFIGELRWGGLPAVFGLTDAAFGFYLIRFMLGVAEAGFYPGVILYLICWFPDARRAQIFALFMASAAFANVLGAPLSGAIMQYLDGAWNWRGWQWLFLLEGVPTIVVGLTVLRMLPDGPQSAPWLDADERRLVLSRLQAETDVRFGEGQRQHVREIFLDLRIWLFIVAYFCLNLGFYALNFWLPTIIQEFGLAPDDYLSVGLIAMIPWGIAATFMIAWSRHSDRTGERRWHATIAALICAAGLLALGMWGQNVVISLVALSMVASGGITWLAVYWSLPTSFLSGSAAAAGIAMINCFGNLGGYFGPGLVGSIRAASGGEASAAFMALGAAAAFGAFLLYILPAVGAKVPTTSD